MVSLVMRRGAENIKEKKKSDRVKLLKNKENEKRTIRQKVNNDYKHIWFYLLYEKLHFA